METGAKDHKGRTVIALDVGERRIGIARASLEAPFPAPLMTLDNPDSFYEDIAAVCRREAAACVVIGLPRGMAGQETAQTAAVQQFGRRLEPLLDVPVYWIDEAVTSAKAEEELKSRGKPYTKGDVDALAAVYILEDFLRENHKQNFIDQEPPYG